MNSRQQEILRMLLTEHFAARLLRKPGTGIHLTISEDERVELFASLFQSAEENTYARGSPDDQTLANCCGHFKSAHRLGAGEGFHRIYSQVDIFFSL